MEKEHTCAATLSLSLTSVFSASANLASASTSDCFASTLALRRRMATPRRGAWLCGRGRFEWCMQQVREQGERRVAEEQGSEGAGGDQRSRMGRAEARGVECCEEELWGRALC